MSKYLKAIALCLGVSVMALPVDAAPYGLGRAALPAEIAAWDIDVHPDGSDLPQGQGDALTGEEIFTEKCAACHGVILAASIDEFRLYPPVHALRRCRDADSGRGL